MKRFENLKDVRLLVMSLDGVLTDGKTWQDVNGNWRRFFSVRDSMGLRALRRVGLGAVVIVDAPTRDVQSHFGRLGVEIWDGEGADRTVVYRKRLAYLGLAPDQAVFVGAEAEDVPLFRYCGLACTVGSASDLVKRAVDYVARLEGGDGAIREICNMILQRRLGALLAKAPNRMVNP